MSARAPVPAFEMVVDPVPAAAPLAVWPGLEMISADTDFARFTELTWHNPIA